jgi:cytosine/creatinine deaminase
MGNMLLQSVAPLGAPPVDLRIKDGRITELGLGLTPQAGEQTIAGHGCIALPGFVDAHAHIDKTLWGMPWQAHCAGPSVLDRIHNERQLLTALALSAEQQSARLIQHMLARGSTHVRTHVDIVPEIGLKHFHGVVATRERYEKSMGMQIVAFPQMGVTSAPGTLALLEEALRTGADVLGGLDPIGIDRDPKGQLDALFNLADRFNVGLDIHLHDGGELGAVTIEMIAERASALSMRSNIVISHGFCLGSVPPARLETLVTHLRELDIAIMTHGPSGGLPSPPVRHLHEQGIRVFSGSDGVRDAWGPLNTGDMLERAYLVAYINGFRDDAGLELALTMATSAGAEVMGLADYGLTSGCKADVVLVEAQTLAECVVAHPARKLVIKAGEVVARDGQCLLA